MCTPPTLLGGYGILPLTAGDDRKGGKRPTFFAAQTGLPILFVVGSIYHFTRPRYCHLCCCCCCCAGDYDGVAWRESSCLQRPVLNIKLITLPPSYRSRRP